MTTLLTRNTDSHFLPHTPTRNINENHSSMSNEMAQRKQLDALIIEHKCKQLMGKANSTKGNAIHLEKWMKSQLDADVVQEAEIMEPLSEEWTPEMLRKRSEELQLIDCQGNVTSISCRSETTNSNRHSNNEFGGGGEKDQNQQQIQQDSVNQASSDHDQSPSKSTTTESQVTVRSSPLVPETVPVCRQCHKNCLSSISASPSSGNQTKNKTPVNRNLHICNDNKICSNRDSKTNQRSLPENLDFFNDYSSNSNNITNGNTRNANRNRDSLERDRHRNREEDDWRPLLLMGLSAINPAACLVRLGAADPFSAPVPQINVAPPTPESSVKTQSTNNDEQQQQQTNSNLEDKQLGCSCVRNGNRQALNTLEFSNSIDISPEDSPQTEEHPYHSLSSSNLTLRRFGTVSSLERLGSTEENNEDPTCHNNSLWAEDQSEENNSHLNNLSDGDDEEDSETGDDEAEKEELGGIDNEAFYQSSIRNWTAKAGSFVAEKMSFFEKLGEDYRSGGRFFERYLKTPENAMNGDDLQEEETSGATSGEEIWGTPTSGGEIDDPLSSPNYEGKQSPYDGSMSSENGDDTELMMDELLMTPPITGAIMRGLLPRRTLEPLIEEDCSESCSSSPSPTHSEPSISPEQGNETGDVADTCSTAAEDHHLMTSSSATSLEQETVTNDQCRRIPSVVVTSESMTTVSSNQQQQHLQKRMLHRSESYRKIVEANDEEIIDLDHGMMGIDHLSMFDRFRPTTTVRFVTNIERVPRTKSAKIFEFFNVRRERRIHQSVPEGRQLIKVFNKEGTISENVPTSYSEKPLSPRRLKDKQLDRRFWKQLSRRRGNKSTTSSSNQSASASM